MAPWIALILAIVVLGLAVSIATRRRGDQPRAVSGSAGLRTVLRVESLSDRIMPSVSPVVLPTLYDTSPGCFAPDEMALHPPSAAPSAVAVPFVANSYPYGATIKINGVEVHVFGPDAAQVQLILFTATGLLLGRPPAPMVETEGKGRVAPRLSSREQVKRLKERLLAFADDLDALEELLEMDVASSLNKVRFITEKALHRLCVSKGVLWGQAEPTLERMKGPLVSREHIPRGIAIHLDTIQRNSSAGSHYQEHPLSSAHATVALTALVGFLEWYAAATCHDPSNGRTAEQAGGPGNGPRS